MRITLILDTARLWRWHLALVGQLTAVPGTRVAVGFAADRCPLEHALALVLALEAAIGDRASQSPVDRITPADLQRWTEPYPGSADLVIDLATTHLPANQSQRTLVPLFDAAPGDAAFWSAVLDGRAPQLSLAHGNGGVTAIGLPALQSPHALRTSAGAVLTRLITGLVVAVQAPSVGPRDDPSGPDHLARPRQHSGLAGPAARLIARKVAVKAQRLLEQTLKTAPQWAVAWRTLPPGHDPLQNRVLDLAAFNVLADDGQRYFADPFLVARGDETDIFIEELPYATGRGLISMATLRADGTITAARPVLEAPHHLSYPQVFARDGAIWMLPEASGSGGLTLYRATRYPDAWEAVARLIDEPAHDATLFEHDGRLWIAANTQGPVSARWGSSWDGLSLYHAPRLLGPWTAHPANPVLIDARSSRSAGCVFTIKNQLYRPVQDCSTGYGVALGLAVITRLDETAFTQTVVARQGFASGPGELGQDGQVQGGRDPNAVNQDVMGPHTQNRAQRGDAILEVIDLFAPRRCLPF